MAVFEIHKFAIRAKFRNSETFRKIENLSTIRDLQIHEMCENNIG
jgi:hypothetical protein